MAFETKKDLVDLYPLIFFIEIVWQVLKSANYSKSSEKSCKLLLCLLILNSNIQINFP